jgi:putative DNA primase/helicase
MTNPAVKPIPLPVSPAAIPAELQALPQWVVWRYIWDRTRWTKVPFQATRPDRKASATDRQTWATFQEALTTYQAGAFDGIGVVLSADLGLIGMDLDHCRDPDSGALEAWAVDIVQAIASYAEVSPSGTGVRLFARGTLAGPGRKVGDGEIYASGRYLTLTGCHLQETPRTIDACQPAIDHVVSRYFPTPAPNGAPSSNGTGPARTDEDLLALIRASTHGGKCARLWAGDLRGYASQSEADLALCILLAGWTRDAVQLDRLVRQSALMRPKWDERHGALTYGAKTIAAALARQTESYTPPGPRETPAAHDTPVSAPALWPGDGQAETECPPLPEIPDEDPALIAKLAAEGSPWLDAYITLSQQWAPRAYADYHEACGLFVLSTVASRRIKIEFGPKGDYPSLYMTLTGRTSMWTKSTAAAIALRFLRAVGLGALLAPDESTPQAFLSGMVGRVPDNYDELTPEKQAYQRLILAFSGQRGWFYEEFGQHLTAMMQRESVMSAFRGVLRRFDDHKDDASTGTIIRGLEIIDRPYLCLLANLTPADLQPYARKGSVLWSDGYFARFAFVVAPLTGYSDAHYPKGRLVYPEPLVNAVHDWHERLKTPSLTIHPTLDDKQRDTRQYTVRRGDFPEHTLQLSDAVWNAYYDYDKAIHTLISAADTQDFDGSYARFPAKALRIAALLASLEDQDKIYLRHWHRGRAIAERWRASLHRLAHQLQQQIPVETREQTVEHLIERALRRLGSRSIRELKQDTHATYSEINKVIDMMLKVGVVAVDEQRSERTTRYGLIIHPNEP